MYTAAPATPSTPALPVQGCVERLNGIVKTKLAAAARCNPGMDWPELLATVQEQINARPTRVLGGQAATVVLFGQPNGGKTAPLPGLPGLDRYAASLPAERGWG